MTTKDEQEQAKQEQADKQREQREQQEQAKRGQADRGSAGAKAGPGSETVRTAGSNQDDVAAQQTPGGVSREEAGLPKWEEDENMKKRQQVDIEADETATTEDWPPKNAGV